MMAKITFVVGLEHPGLGLKPNYKLLLYDRIFILGS